ncbi:hypothetical protein [Brevundimonas sp.]|uniref:hypothetical protein n=1 Tax=Brevundimonas sp. TaxID=1871086 RepID=UPI002ED99786
MKAILAGAVSVFALTLAACQQPATPAGEAPTADADEATAAAGPDAGGAGTTAPTAASTERSMTSGAGGTAAPDASTAVPPPGDGGMMDGPSQATRDMAKEKAEETNLHPRTP